MSDRSYASQDQDRIEFGSRLRELRIARGLSQEELAHRAGLHRTVVGFIERGERDVRISLLWRVAPALDVTISELFEGLGPRTT